MIRNILLFFLFIFSIEKNCSFDDSPRIDEINKYFESFESCNCELIQTNPDGTKQFGKMYWDRSNQRIKINYDVEKISIYLDKKKYLIIDHLDKKIQSFDISDTPISILLNKKFNLKDKRIKIHFLEERDGNLYITIKQYNDDRVKLTLSFLTVPSLKLIGWVTRDIQGNTTIIDLSNIHNDKKIDKNIFNIPNYEYVS